MAPQSPPPPQEGHTRERTHWRASRHITALLLCAWGGISFIVYYADSLDFTFFGWPFSFWMAAQGALLVYCLIVWYYARHMDQLDEKYRNTPEAPEQD